MCLHLGYTKEIKSKPKFKIAKQDITVYKVIGKNGGGCYRDLRINGIFEPWTPGYIYTETAFRQKALKLVANRYEIHGDALHSTKSLNEARSRCAFWEKVVEMVIPKGAFYYENKNEYASSSLYYPKQ